VWYRLDHSLDGPSNDPSPRAVCGRIENQEFPLLVRDDYALAHAIENGLQKTTLTLQRRMRGRQVARRLAKDLVYLRDLVIAAHGSEPILTLGQNLGVVAQSSQPAADAAGKNSDQQQRHQQ